MNISAPIIDQRYKPDEKVAEIWARQQAEKEAVRGGPITLPKFTYPSNSQANRKASWPLDEPPQTPPKGPRSPTTPKTTASSSKSPTDHKRNQQSYSLFPGSDDLRLPATVYTPMTNPFSSPRNASVSKQRSGSNATASPSKLTSPSVKDVRETALQPPVAPWTAGHRRGSSTDSSATVQIGIRFSTAPAALAASAFRGNSTLASNRPSLRAVIDNITPPQSELKLTTTNEPIQSRLESPFDHQWDPQSSEPDIEARQSGASKVSDFAWLETTEAESPPTFSASANYSSQQLLQIRTRPTAESNRYEIEALQRSGSARSRQGYKPPTTPDGPSTGFF
jgi:hypothetical protein